MGIKVGLKKIIFKKFCIILRLLYLFVDLAKLILIKYFC